jgi:hypothetical protein
MKIDPKDVTSQDLDQYENLMQGSLANGSSNANYQKGVVGDLTKGVRSTHTWRNDYNQ